MEVPVYVEQAVSVEPTLFKGVTPEYLLAIGVPTGVIQQVLVATEDDIFTICAGLPDVVAESVVRLATGDQGPPVHPDPLDNINGHQTDRSRALVAARLAMLFMETGRLISRANLLNSKKVPTVQHWGNSSKKAAIAFGVSVDSVRKWVRILNHAISDLQLAARLGDLSLEAAFLLSKLSRDEQQRLVSTGAAKRVAREIRLGTYPAGVFSPHDYP